jgi:hypothetical protein
VRGSESRGSRPARIRDEKRADTSDMAGLYSVATEILQKRIVVVTSVVAKAEIEQGQFTPDRLARFNRVFDLSNVEAVDLSEAIATKAGQFRNHFRSL